MPLTTVAFMFRALLLGHLEGSSAWGIFLLWALRIVSLSLIFRTYIGPSVLRLITDRLQVRSVSLRSIRGIYFRARSGILRVNRVGLSYHRPSSPLGSRFSIKVEGVHLQLTRNNVPVPSKPSSPLGGRPRRRIFAHLAPSPLASRACRLVSRLCQKIYTIVDPYLRPLLRKLFVTVIRLGIRALPAITHVVDFELDIATVTFSNVPGVVFEVKEATLQSKVALSLLESVIPVDHKAHRAVRGHKRFASVADWNTRFTNSVRRTWDRAWGATQVAASVSLQVRKVSGLASPAALGGILQTPCKTSRSFIDVPSFDFSVSVRVDPHQGIEPHSVETSFVLDTVDLDFNAIQHVLSILKKPREAKVQRVAPEPQAMSPPPSGMSWATPTSPSSPMSAKMRWKSAMSPSSPLREALSASMRFRWGGKQFATRRVHGTNAPSRMSSLKTINLRVTKLSVRHFLPQTSHDAAQTFVVAVNNINIGAGLSHPDANLLHREWLGSRSVPGDKLSADVYRLNFSTDLLTLDRTGSRAVLDHLQVFSTTHLRLDTIVTQWPRPWLKEPKFLSGDPNAQLLALNAVVGPIQFIEQLDALQALLSRTKMPKKPRDTRPLLPTILSPVPRIVFGLQVERIRVCLFSSNTENDDALFAVEAQTEGLVASATSRFATVPDQRTRPIEHDQVGVQMDFDLSVAMRRTFINVCFGSDVGLEHRQDSAAGLSSLSGEALLSVDTIQFAGHGNAVGDMMDELQNAVTIDVASVYTDLHCWTDAISVELWHPDVIKAVAKIFGSFSGGSQKDTVTTAPRHILDQLPFGLSASLAVGRCILFVTSPDLAPEERLNLSRGVASHSGICVSYCAVHNRHFERVRDVLSRSQRRLQLALPTEQILRAVARTAVPNATSNVRALFHVALWDIVLRDAVATRFAADDPYFTADHCGELKSHEFLHIKNVDTEIILSGNRPLESHPMALDECSVVVTVSSLRGSFHLAQVYNLLLAARTIQSFASKPSPRSVQARPIHTMAFSCQAVVNELQLLWEFPIRTKLFARISALNFLLSPERTVDIRWSNIILAVTVPAEHDEVQKEEWEEFARLPDWRINVKPSVRPISVVVDADSSRIRIPYDFILADLILDINVTIKSIKHLVRMVAAGHYEEPPVPEAEDAKNVPNVLLRLRRLTVEAIDEDIESRLALIWRTASDAARIRKERDDAFEAKVTAIRKANLPHATPTAHDAASDFQFSPDHSIPVDDARNRLYQVHSVAWVSGYRQARASQTSRQEEFLRHSNFFLRDKFEEDLVFVNSPQPVPPLCRLTLDRLVLYLTAPALPSSSLAELLHTTGGGLPRDTQFSLLVPMHLNFTVSSLRMSYREYPLPLLNIPPSSVEATPGLEFDSDVVIAEEMGTAHSVEWISCEIVKPNHGAHGAFPLSLSIPKTIMPVKSYANPVIRVGTDDVTDFTWGVSYSPATQDLMRIIDTLSHASRDRSPPIGFWDKLRLVFHWRLKITFEHEVHLHMKGSRNPYELGGHGAGFALCWRGSPQLLIGQENIEGELIQMISETMLVVIPNVHESYGDSAAAKPYSHNTATLPFTTSQPQRARRYRKICAKLSSGVRFGVGFVLERSCGPECSDCTGKPFDRHCRYFHFKPHYEVMLETKTITPEAKSSEDSYNGFRSDFIHLSVSLVSAIHPQRPRQTPLSSSLHLSPEVFAHFWAWWSLFDGALSLPIRQGQRYTRKRPRPVSPKFGQHLATLKYRISIARLFISHSYSDQASDAWIDGVTPYVGIKALINHFQADMHQRDQESSRVTLGGIKTIHHKPFHAVEVVMRDMEMRTMLAVFSDSLKEEVSMEAPTFTGNYRTECKSEPVDPKSPWIDLDDFDRTEWAAPTTPTVHLLPTVFCPRFTYFKRPKDDDKTDAQDSRVERTKFGGEDTHVCSLGREASVTQVQIDLALTRIKELQERLSRKSKPSRRNSGQTSPAAGSSGDSQPSDDIGDVPKMITLLENYITQLRAVEAESSSTGVNGHQTYYMPADTVSPEEWAQFDNVYQVHSPQIFMDNTIRDTLLQYYHLSRARRGIEYHMAARAVKFIRDQAQTALTELLHDAEDPKERLSSAQAAALAVRKLLVGDGDKGTPVEMAPTLAQRVPDSVNPLNGWSAEGVHLRQSHFCLMLKPQIILRSEAGTNSVCVLAAVQGKLKTFAIMDNANADDPVSGKIMSRNFVSVTGLQTFSPSALNTSGEGYVPLEVLIDLRSENGAFDRLVPQTDATFQYDKFNRLRLRNNVTSITRTNEKSDTSHNHLRDQTDLIRVHVPRFTISANDRHFEAISSITTGLVLFTDSTLKARSDKLEKMLFSYDFTNLASAADVVANMQSRLRHAIDTRREAAWKLRGTGELGQVEILKIHAHILLLAEELNLVFDAIKLAQDRANDDPDQKSALLLHASSSEISWRMLDQQDQLIAKLAVRDIDFYWLSRHDSSTVNNLAVGDLQAFDGAADAQWTEILSKYDEPSTHPMVKSKLFLLADWKVLPPVGGITIYEAFEVTFHPLRLQIDTRLGRKIMEYVWPARKNREVTDEIQSFDQLLDSPTTAIDNPMNAPIPKTSRRLSWDLSPRKSLDTNKLTASPLRRLGSSRSFTDLRNARSDTLQIPRLHRTRSTDALIGPATPTSSSAAQLSRSIARTASRKEVDDAAEMKTRSSQKTFVWVRVASLHLMLSIAKEDSFLCRDARIRTRDLEYRNQTLSFEELVDQFIPSGRNWRGWIKMAFQQPLVPVLPVAREIIAKTKWINTKGHQHEEHSRPSTPRVLTLKGPRRDATVDTKRSMSRGFFTRPPTPKSDAMPLTSESEPIPDLPGTDGPNSNTSKFGRSRVLSVFKRKHGSSETRRSSDSENSMVSGPPTNLSKQPPD